MNRVGSTAEATSAVSSVASAWKALKVVGTASTAQRRVPPWTTAARSALTRSAALALGPPPPEQAARVTPRAAQATTASVP
ncbi:hypothetical protein [Streptacidiphilus sp. PAMC 29251]